MQLKNYQEVDGVRFDNEVAKGIHGRVLIGKADGAPNFCMRMFEVAPGGHTPKHAHDWEHEIFFHSGKGEVYGNGGWNAVSSGSIVFMPGGEEHQIKNTGDAPLMFVCLVPSGAPEM